jgi:uncharacterized protein
VTRVWLHKQLGLRSRIETLRAQKSLQKSIPQNQKASASSKDGLIKTLQQRIKKIKSENQELRKQIEVAYGITQADTAVSRFMRDTQIDSNYSDSTTLD